MADQIYLRPPLGGKGIGDYTLHDFVAKWMMQQDDIAEIATFADANAALLQSDDTRNRVVMFGDSITAFWDLAPFETEAVALINRGIPGQNSSQMVLRFVDDVVALKPRKVGILCGTNDLRAYVGDPASVADSALARIRRNLVAMCDIAKANNIAVVLATLPPVCGDRDRVNRDSDAIRTANAWLKVFAEQRGYPLADYHRALADKDGHLPAELGEDGLHPSPSGYALMWPMLRVALGL